MDAMETLVQNLVMARYDNLSDAVKERVKISVLDILGVIIAGSTAPGCKAVVDLVRESGGNRQGTIAVYGHKVTALDATWCNAMMGRARDFDDCDETTGDHPSVGTVSTAMAVSELRKITGKDVILAVALGVDLVLRIRSSLSNKVRTELHSFGTEFYSYFGAAAVASKLLQLNQEKTMDAMGLAYCQMSGTSQSSFEGKLSVRVQHGLAARSGLLSALLAEIGITGPHNVLDGAKGLYAAYYPNKEVERGVLFDRLGENHLITRVTVKPYPACQSAQCGIEGSIKLVREHDIKPEDISSIKVMVNQPTYVNICQPEKVRPQSVPAAQFSLAYNLAVAITKRTVTFQDFTEESIKDPTVLAVSEKIQPVVDPELTALNKMIGPTILEITMKDGKIYSTKVENIKGNPKRPMMWEDCVDKFLSCVPLSAKPISKKNLNHVIDLVHGLENVTDVSQIIQALVG